MTMNARRLATALALTSLVAAGPLSADARRPELGKPEVRAALRSPSLVAWFERWLESWMLAVEPPPTPEPDERPTEGPQSDPNG